MSPRYVRYTVKDDPAAFSWYELLPGAPVKPRLRRARLIYTTTKDMGVGKETEVVQSHDITWDVFECDELPDETCILIAKKALGVS